MGLRDIKVARREIPVGGTSLSVRGIGTSDLMVLVAQHAPVVSTIFTRVVESELTSSDIQVTDIDTQKLLFSLATEFPEVVSAIIALACDEYDAEGLAAARTLSFEVEVQAIRDIFALTFASEGGVKKMIESLIEMAAATSGAMAAVSDPASPSGIGASVGA